MTKYTRRKFLGVLAAGGSAAALAACNGGKARRKIPGRIVNAGPPKGHALRRATSWVDFSAPESALYDVVIVGGGVSGVAAAWKLRRAGVDRILLLDLEDELGGTSRSGKTESREFPWGAHYINIPPAEADCIHEVLLDIGVLEGYDTSGKPLVGDGSLLRWPHERFFYQGRWNKGLDRFIDTWDKDQEAHRRFEDEMLRWSLYRGRDGRRAFSLPMQYSSTDSRVRRLDQISMAQYLAESGWHSGSLKWLVDYACRDDYGSLAHQVSAWAGIHYYACRYYDYRVQEEYPSHTLTWAGGNGHLVKRMARDLQEHEIRLSSPVVRLEQDHNQVRLGYLDLSSGQRRRLQAKAVVYAGKLHTLPHVMVDLPKRQADAMTAIDYSPWLVAAIFLRSPLESAATTWDNILPGSPSLGYVVADHQHGDGGKVLIYYWPFAENIDQARKDLLSRDHQYWSVQIMDDLRRAHTDIDDVVERIDLYRWGHGMMRPSPGTLWGRAASLRQRALQRVFLASCDTTGLPLYEEAVFSGIRAAEQAMGKIGITFQSSLDGLGHA